MWSCQSSAQHKGELKSIWSPAWKTISWTLWSANRSASCAPCTCATCAHLHKCTILCSCSNGNLGKTNIGWSYDDAVKIVSCCWYSWLLEFDPNWEGGGCMGSMAFIMAFRQRWWTSHTDSHYGQLWKTIVNQKTFMVGPVFGDSGNYYVDKYSVITIVVNSIRCMLCQNSGFFGCFQFYIGFISFPD